MLIPVTGTAGDHDHGKFQDASTMPPMEAVVRFSDDLRIRSCRYSCSSL